MSQVISSVKFDRVTPRYVAGKNGNSSVVAAEFRVTFHGVPGFEYLGTLWGRPSERNDIDRKAKLIFEPSGKGTSGMTKAVSLSPELAATMTAHVKSVIRSWPDLKDVMISATRVYRAGPVVKATADDISLDTVADIETGETIETPADLSL